MPDLKPVFLPLTTSENTRWELDIARAIQSLIDDLRLIMNGLNTELITTYGFFHDRGLVTAADFSLAGTPLVTDATWRNIDISSIVPVDTKAVLCRVTVEDNATMSIFYLKNNTGATDLNVSQITTQVANIALQMDCIVPVGSDRILKYWGTNTTFTDITILIKGWWK